MKKYLLIGGAVCILGILGMGVYIFQRQHSTTDEAAVFAMAAATSSAPESSTTPLLPPRQVPAGSIEYRNTTYRFSLFYPTNLTLSAYDEGGGATTITF
jgi:hypothetical protein